MHTKGEQEVYISLKNEFPRSMIVSGIQRQEPVHKCIYPNVPPSTLKC
jgi:hypothetical protein